ncbi:MAG TPA: hypothetical protein DEH78_20265, partial [Solibacterales bacterium]|nr:hypothetical protein [Bryobacterales bacterium]
FSQYSGTEAVPTAITDWTVTTSISNFELDSTNYYRDFVGDTTPRSLRIKANDTVTQNFNVGKARFNPFTPYYLQIAYNRQVYSGDGTLTITLGSRTTNVVLAAQTGWNVLRMPIGQNNWHSRWNQENAGVAIALSSRTTGSVLVDDVVLVPYDNFDGSWYAIVGGSTPFLRKDKANWTDTATEGAIVQYFLWRFFNGYLPHTTGGSVTWTEP